MLQNQIDFQTINYSLLPQLDGLLAVWLPGGRREGKEYVALNPLRTDHAPGSFRINRVTGRWGDFATGDHGGDIISLYAYLNRISQREAARALSSPAIPLPPVVSKAAKSAKVVRLDTARIFQKIWNETSPAKGTLVEVYFASRGYQGKISETLRFHSALFHAPSKTTWPAMVAAITRWPDNELIGIHRTWLARDGKTKAPVQPQKMMLGAAAGGAVRLGRTGNPLVIGEGIETSISVQGTTALSAWAALSTSGMKLLTLPPPEITEEIIIAADHDPAGVAAAHYCAEKWQAQGRNVKIALPPEGKDFNDLLMETGV